MKKYAFVIISFCLLFSPLSVKASDLPNETLSNIDSDNDGLTDVEEKTVYYTNPYNSDSDFDGYLDGDEVKYVYDPNKAAPGDKLEKNIVVNLKSQELTYSLGPYHLRTIKVSTGVRGKDTPKGEFSILKKLPKVLYKGPGYYYPNTRWNMLFKYNSGGNYYIHGAFWHNNFGKPMSRGCVNVSYKDVEALYNWADLGTRVTIY